MARQQVQPPLPFLEFPADTRFLGHRLIELEGADHVQTIESGQQRRGLVGQALDRLIIQALPQRGEERPAHRQATGSCGSAPGTGIHGASAVLVLRMNGSQTR